MPLKLMVDRQVPVPTLTSDNHYSLMKYSSPHNNQRIHIRIIRL